MQFNEHWSPIEQHNHDYGIECPEPAECKAEGCHKPALKGYEACTAHSLRWAQEEHEADPWDNGLWENYCELLGIARAEGLAR